MNPFERGEDYDELTLSELWDLEEELGDTDSALDGRDEPELPVEGI